MNRYVIGLVVRMVFAVCWWYTLIYPNNGIVFWCIVGVGEMAAFYNERGG